MDWNEAQCTGFLNSMEMKFLYCRDKSVPIPLSSISLQKESQIKL
jgi:hypothetical protein